MIKLIAADMDGTLLDDSKQLPINFSEVINDLSKNKKKFVIASGRSFCSLKEQFQNYLDTISFICDNGAYVVDSNQVMSVSVLKSSDVKRIVRFCEMCGITPILCGRNGTWHSGKSQDCTVELTKYYNNSRVTDDLTKCDDEIFKIAVYEKSGIENHGFKELCQQFGKEFNVQLSGNYWTDIMAKGITKGTALKAIANKYGINYEETMSFGDYLNDVDMLNNSYYSFAMANSHEEVKKTANFTTGSNNENSVMKEIIKYVL